MPKCYICKEAKDPSSFYFYKGRPLSKCKSCHNKMSIERQKITGYHKSEAGKESWRRASEIAYRKHIEKWRCRAKTRYYVKIGKLIKLDCEICGRLSQAHHKDYKKPLQVEWLCVKHHREKHLTLDS